MPLRKIISGGQTGADQGALDAAIRFGIDHGGWIPKGRRTEKGPLPDRYHLKEMPGPSYPARTRQNVMDADGTLIFSHGRLRGGSALTHKITGEIGKPVLHIDLTQTGRFQSAQQIAAWLDKLSIQVLNVAGTRASEDPKLYQAVSDVLETVFYLQQVAGGWPAEAHTAAQAPETLKEVIPWLADQMALRDRSTLANMPFSEAAALTAFRLWVGRVTQLDAYNDALVADCCQQAKGADSQIWSREAAIDEVLFALWRHLKATHRLRRIK